MIRCKAPLRISFAGGGTDVSPFVEEHGGTVLNAAINLYSYCTLKPVEEDEIRIIDHDIGIEYVSKNGNPFKYDGVNDIAKAIINELLPLPGFELRLHTDARRGTGLGSSSTHAVTVLQAIYTWAGTELTSYDLAEKAYKIERIDLDQKGGRQDQYSAVFGGINFIEFEKSGTLVNPLNIKDEVLKELDYRMVFCSLNNTRSSPEIISVHYIPVTLLVFRFNLELKVLEFGLVRQDGNYLDKLNQTQYIQQSLLETARILNELSQDTSKIEEIALLWANCLRGGNKIMFCGNGGSAGDSQHMVGELVGRFYKNREPLAAVSLSTDTTVLTAVSNDYSFEEVYSRQVQALGKQGDVLVGISTSGSSRNVLKAIKAATDLNIFTVCVTGLSGKGITGADMELIIPSLETPRIQEGYFSVGHIICGLVEQIIFPN